MAVDIYTKGLLTVIAIALTILTAQSFISNAVASNGYQKVMICDVEGDCAKVTKKGQVYMWNPK